MPVTVVAFLVREQWDPLIRFDQRIIVATTDITRAHPGLREALIAWQEGSAPKVIYAIGAITCLAVGWRRPQFRSRAWWAFITMMVAWNLQLVLKEIVQRARPVVTDPVSHAPGYSFPSGHAANAAAFATILVLFLWPLLSPAWRRVAVALAAVFVVVTALDRVMLGVHFPSDVTAGVLFGVGLAVASYAGYVGWRPAALNDPPPPEGHAGPETLKEKP